MLAQVTDEEGYVSRVNYLQMFSNIASEELSEPNPPVDEIAGVIFDIFEQQSDKIDFAEIACALAVLCGSSQNEAAVLTFALMNASDSGFLSITEAKHYLLCVSRLLLCLKEPLAAERYQVVLESLFDFGDVLLDLDSFLEWRASWFPFEEFSAQQLNSWCSLLEIRHLTGMEQLTVTEVFELFANVTNNDGLIARDDFVSCFESLISMEGKQEDTISGMLFDLFVKSDSETVDFSEVCSGLAQLCTGTRLEKAAACFSLFDYNNNGYISHEELGRYLVATSLVAQLYLPELDVSVFEFAENVVNRLQEKSSGSEVISFEEFEELVASGVLQLDSWLSLDEARRLTGLEEIAVEDVFQLFAALTNNDGCLDREGYNQSFAAILNRNRLLTDLTNQERQRAVHISQLLFGLFRLNGSDEVDFTEICTGVAVLCRNHSQQVDEAVFKLYDYDDKGVIAFPEMVRYLSSVFRVMYDLEPSIQLNMGIPADTLAEATASEAFKTSSLTSEGDLPFEHFLRWYLKPQEEESNSEVSKDGYEKSLSLLDMRQLTNLVQYSIPDVFEIFAEQTDNEGYISYESFSKSFDVIGNGIVLSADDDVARTSLLRQLFDIFDIDDDGVVDFTELMSGLSIICVGSKIDKLKTVFSLYDYDRRGYIAPDEVNRYLRSVYNVLFALQPEVIQHVGVSAEELARLMTQRCFAECETNEEGRADFENFAGWLLQHDVLTTSENTQPETPDESYGDQDQPQLEIPQINLNSLAEVRHLTKLQEFSVDEVCQIFREQSSNENFLTFVEFRNASELIVLCGGGHSSEGDKQQAQALYRALYTAFDVDEDGIVTFDELVSGLVVLCGGSRDDKVRAAFELFDLNGNGEIELSEMSRYLTSVFRILYEISPATAASMNVTAQELGQSTAYQCFEDAGKSPDASISYEEFKHWYTSNN
jgi:Ca2+-binding EF-hand superfamily protein